MSTKPVNINMKTLITAMQSGGRVTSSVGLSAASEPVALGIDEPLNVEGIKTLLVYAGGTLAAAEVTFIPAGPFVPFHDTGGAITIVANTAKILDVSGIKFIQFTEAVTVVLTS